MTKKSLTHRFLRGGMASFLGLTAFAAQHAYLWESRASPPPPRLGKSRVAAAKRAALKTRNCCKARQRGFTETTLLNYVASALFIAAAFLVGLTTGREQIQGKWNLHKLAMAENAVKASEDYREKERAWNKQLQEARDESNQWKTKAATAVDQWRVVNSKLRDLTADINGRLSKSTLEASNRVARTYGDLLNQCDSEQSRMASAADECVAAYIELDRAWP